MIYETKVKQFPLLHENSESDALNEVMCLGYEVVSSVKSTHKLTLVVRRDKLHPYYDLFCEMEKDLDVFDKKS